jgi:hypothetical protein
MFFPDPDLRIFSSRISDPRCQIPDVRSRILDPTTYVKRGVSKLTYFFLMLAVSGVSFKTSLVFQKDSITRILKMKKMQENFTKKGAGSGDPGSGKNLSRF